MSWWNAVLPVATLVLGSVLTVYADERRDQRSRHHASEDRRHARSDRREEFELSTLSELYSALNSLARHATSFHLLDLKAARSHGVLYGSVQIPDADGLDEALRLDHVEVNKLNALVLDDQLREDVDAAVAQLGDLALGQPLMADEAEAHHAVAVNAIARAQRAIAERIRELYQRSEV